MRHPQPPIRVAFDLHRLSGGGFNGGIKVHHFEFLDAFLRLHADKISLSVICQAELAPELSFLSSSHESRLHVVGSPPDPSLRECQPTLPPIRFWETPPANFLHLIGADVLYAGFGYSAFHSPDVPQVSLLADCLHRDLPEMLPPEEVEARENQFQSAINQASLIQTSSRFSVSQLRQRYGLPEDKLLLVYLPLLERFNRTRVAALPLPLASNGYFYYPANFWPHKNHECLLVGFQKYLRDTPRDGPRELVLTGFPDARSEELQQLCRSLGIEKQVRFLGHLPGDIHKAVWEHAFALVLPTLYEGFGIPLFEAKHFQKRVAYSDIPCLREFADEACLPFDARKPEAIARALAAVREAEGQHPGIPDLQMKQESGKLADAFLRLLRPAKLPASATPKPARAAAQI